MSGAMKKWAGHATVRNRAIPSRERQGGAPLPSRGGLGAVHQGVGVCCVQFRVRAARPSEQACGRLQLSTLFFNSILLPKLLLVV
jgi:hypothetical protein